MIGCLTRGLVPLCSALYIRFFLKLLTVQISTTMSEHEVKSYEHPAIVPGRSLSKRVRLRELQLKKQKAAGIETEETIRGI
jgi:hypothetical protein